MATETGNKKHFWKRLQVVNFHKLSRGSYLRFLRIIVHLMS